MTREERLKQMQELQKSSAQLRESIATRRAERERRMALGLERDDALLDRRRTAPAPGIRKVTTTPPRSELAAVTREALTAELRKHGNLIGRIMGEEVSAVNAALEGHLRKEIDDLRRRIAMLETLATMKSETK